MKNYSGRITILSLLIIFYSNIQTNAQNDSLLTNINSTNGKEKVELLNKYAASFVSRNPAKRLQVSKQALSEARKINYKKGIADAINNCGLCYYYQHNYLKALQTFKKSYPLFVELQDSAAIGGTYNNFANSYQKMGILDSAVLYNKHALEIRRKINSTSGMATSITNLGLLDVMRGDFSSALNYFQRALELRTKLGHKLSIASSLNSIGALFWQWGNLNSALDYYNKSLELSESVNYMNGIIITKLNIGLINIDLGSYDFAQKYITSAILEADSTNSEKGKANGFYYLAILNNAKGEWNSSLNNIEKCIPFFKKENDYNALSKIYTLEAKNYISINNYIKAGQVLNSSIVAANNVDDKSLVAAALQIKGLLELRKNNYKVALYNTNRSLEINKKNNILEKEIEDYEQIAEIQKKMKDYKAEAISLEQYAILKDSLFNKRLAGNIANWRVKYETANKENKILKLNKENGLHLIEISKQKTIRNFFIVISLLILSLLLILIYLYMHHKKLNEIISNQNLQLDTLNNKLANQNSELIKSNNTKDKLFSIIAHDLKGPFSSLLGYTTMLGEDIKDMDKEEVIAITKYLNETSSRLYKLTNNLLDWARLQTGSIEPKPRNLNVKNEVEEFIQTIKPAAREKGIFLEADIPEHIAVYCDPQMLNTVLRNLTNNAVKFTNKGGTIKISSEEETDRVIFRIADNGIGMEPTTLDRILNEDNFISTKGTQGEPGTGIGINICKELINMSNGKLYIKSQPGEGTEFSFDLPSPTKYSSEKVLDSIS